MAADKEGTINVHYFKYVKYICILRKYAREYGKGCLNIEKACLRYDDEIYSVPV